MARHLLGGAGSSLWAIASLPEVRGKQLGAATLSSAWCLLDTKPSGGSCLQELIAKPLEAPVVDFRSP